MYLDRLLDCHPVLLATLATATFPLLQQFPGHCSKANLTIAKTIRLRGSHLRDWLERSDVKVPLGILLLGLTTPLLSPAGLTWCRWCTW